jgi:hypothetical protein
MSAGVVILGVVGILIAGTLVHMWLQSRHGASRLLAKTVTVHTRDDQSIRGVLTQQYADMLTLEQAAYLAPGGTRHNFNGPAHIPLSNVAWLEEIVSAAAEPTTYTPPNGRTTAGVV